MLAVKLNLANYEYDVHSLVKAFYPEETVKVITPETKVETAEEALKEAGSALLEIALAEDGAIITCDGNLHEWNYADMDVRFKDGFKKF